MKTPLRYQMTEYDCGPTAMTNAISFLYDTHEIPPDFVKMIYQCTLDDCSDKGVPFRMGTSPCALAFMGEWFNRYAEHVGYPIHREYYEKGDVTFIGDSPLVRGLRNGATAVVKCIMGVEHYVTVTGIDDTYIHVFDPYYKNLRNKTFKEGICERQIEIVKDKPMEMNRRIPINSMDCQEHCLYAMQNLEKRVALLFFKTKQWANVPML